MLNKIILFLLLSASICVQAANKIQVNLNSQTVSIFENDSVVKEMKCSTGKPKTPTPSGQFSTFEKEDYKWFENLGVGAYYWTKFNGHISFHSTLYDKNNDLIIVENEKLGTAVSGGCVRLFLNDAKWIYDNIPLNTTVIVI